MAGRLDTVRCFRVQALLVVVNWFYSLRKITIPVAAVPHRMGDAGHTSACFPVCWYGCKYMGYLPNLFVLIARQLIHAVPIIDEIWTLASPKIHQLANFLS